jgi:hypothetical protein
MSFYANNAEQMRLTSTGLGIGTSSPAYKIEASSSTNNYIGVTCTVDGNAASRFKNTQRDWLVGVLGSASGALGFYDNTAGSERLRIDSSGNVGIGTTSPDSKLHVLNSTVAGLRIGFNGTSFNFYDADAQIFRSGNGTERMRLDTSGNLGLGVTPSAWAGFTALQIDDGFAAWSSGVANARINANTYYNGGNKYIGTGTATMYEQDGYHAWYTAPSGTAGNAITFTQAMTLASTGQLMLGTTSTTSTLSVDIQNVSASSNNVLVQIKNTITGEDTGLIISGFNTSQREYRIGVNTVANTPNLTLSGPTGYGFYVAGTERVTIDSDGLKFNGDTAAANALDDYEEGTWTATLVSSGGGTVTLTSSARYSKIGNLVFVSVESFSISTTGLSAGDLTITGLPFTCNANNPAIAYFDIAGAVTASVGSVLVYAANTTTMSVYKSESTSSAIALLQKADLNSDVSIRFNGTYTV